MKKIIILLLIVFLSCSDSKEFEPIEQEPICYVVYSTSTGNGSNFFCDSGILITFIEKETWDSGDWTRNDKIEICVTNPDYEFNDFRLFQIYCDLDVFTN